MSGLYSTCHARASLVVALSVGPESIVCGMWALQLRYGPAVVVHEEGSQPCGMLVLGPGIEPRIGKQILTIRPPGSPFELVYPTAYWTSSRKALLAIEQAFQM